jgi:hypothetical protein
MRTQNKKFTTILLAGFIAGGALALGYACGGDDTTGQGTPPQVDSGTTGAGGSAGATGAGGSSGGGVGGAGGGTGGAAGNGTGGSAGSAGTGMCPASGSFDNVKAKTLFPADGGVPAL